MAKAIAEPTGEKTCPVCGKVFFVQWPSLWVFKRGAPYPKYFCSYSCIREFDRRMEDETVYKKRILSPENEAEAVKCAIAGGNPLEYLRNCGIKNPSACWQHIKQKVHNSDPDTFAKIPNQLPARRTPKAETPKLTMDGIMADILKTTDEFFEGLEDMGLTLQSVPHRFPSPCKAETPETPATPFKAIALKSGMNYKIRSIQTDLGTYSADDEYFEFKSSRNKSDVIELTIDDMIQLAKELPDAMKLLGVEL